jgi:hypothetical protein
MSHIYPIEKVPVSLNVKRVASPSGAGVCVFVFEAPVILIFEKDSAGALTKTIPEPPAPPF